MKLALILALALLTFFSGYNIGWLHGFRDASEATAIKIPTVSPGKGHIWVNGELVKTLRVNCADGEAPHSESGVWSCRTAK